MFFEAVETSVDHGVSVEEVEKVHEPKDRLMKCWLCFLSSTETTEKAYHHVPVQLLDKGNLFGVGLGCCTKLVDTVVYGRLLKVIVLTIFDM
jgi:hypothetical protein